MSSVRLFARPLPVAVAVALVLTSIACSKEAEAKGGTDGTQVAKAPASQPATPKALDVAKVVRRDKELQPLTPRTALDAPSTAALDAMLKTYLALKDALVTSDLAKVKPAYAAFEGAMAAFKKVAPPTAAKAALARQLQEVDEGMKWIAEHGATLPAHRRGFAAISEGVMTTAASFNHHVPVFVQHCPMALDEGAMWLSTSKNIRNPYYGDRMMECGEVQGEIPAS